MPAVGGMQNPQYCTAMAQLYRLLAMAVNYPERTWLTCDYWETLALTWAEITAGQMTVHMPAYPQDEQSFEALQVEYTRLFINAVPHVVAPMYGSVYLEPDGVLYGSSAEQVKDFYQQRDVSLNGASDIPDFLGTELKFLALLMDEKREDEAEQFLSLHFRPWFKLFKQRVTSAAQHPYFLVLIHLINFFTEEEMAHGN